MKAEGGDTGDGVVQDRSLEQLGVARGDVRSEETCKRDYSFDCSLCIFQSSVQPLITLRDRTQGYFSLSLT